MLPIDPPLKFILFASWIDLFAQCAGQIGVYSSSELKLQAWFPTSSSPMFQLTSLITRRVSCRISPPETEVAQDVIGKNVTFLCFRQLLASTTSCYTLILCRPAPLCSKSCLSQGICTPTEQFVALLWVNKLLYFTNLELSIFLNNGEDHHTILVELVTVGGMHHS